MNKVEDIENTFAFQLIIKFNYKCMVYIVSLGRHVNCSFFMPDE